VKIVHVVGFILSAVSAVGSAAPFKVYSPIVETGVTEVEYRGFRDFDRRDDVNRSATHKLGIGRGLSDRWATEVYGEFEREGNEALRLESYEWENLFQFAPQGKYWADTGLLVEYEHPARADDPRKLTLAPLIEKELGDRFVATVNLRFSVEGGTNSTPGTTFSYAAQLKYNLAPKFDPAIEAFGEPGRLNHFSGYSRQPHWIGPAFYGKVNLEHGQALTYSAAALIGVSRAASDTRAVFRMEYEF